MSDIKIHRLNSMKLRRPYVIIGFPGTGLVGSVAATQLVESLKLEFGGYITSSAFAPLAAIHNYKPMPAARIHYSTKYNLVVILSEMSIPVGSSMDLAEKIFEFAKSLKSVGIVSLGGISLKEEKDVVYMVSSNREVARKLLAKKMVKPIKEGATTGVTGLLLARGSLENFPVITILAESAQDYLDPNAAAKTLKVLSEFLNIAISTKELDAEAKDVAKQVNENVLKSKLSKHGKTTHESGSMYG